MGRRQDGRVTVLGSYGMQSEKLVKELGRDWVLIWGILESYCKEVWSWSHMLRCHCKMAGVPSSSCHSIPTGAVRMSVALGTVRGTYQDKPRNGWQVD